MNSRALLVALGVSLLFNVFVLVGFARARSHHPDRAMNDSRMIERMVRELNLDEKQRNVLVSLREDQRNEDAYSDEEPTANSPLRHLPVLLMERSRFASR